MKKIILTIIAIFFVFSNRAFAIEEIQIQKGQKLYLADCIKIAVQNSPIIKKAEQKFLIAETDVSLAKSDYFPTIGASTGYWQKFNSDSDYDDGQTKYSLPDVSLYLSQLIYNFGKTSSKIQMQKFYKISAEYNYLDSICATINDVKLKYCEVLQAQAALDVAKQNVSISERMLNMTKKFYEQKKKSKIDYINAQVYLSDAKIELEEANNRYIQAYTDLCNSMYVAGAPDFEIMKIDTFDYYDAFFSPSFLETSGEWHIITHRPRETDKGMGQVQKIHFSLEEAYDSAIKNSPDLKAMESVVKAMEKSVLNIKREFYPSLKMRAGYDYDHLYKDSIKYKYSNNQFNIGVTLDANINAMQHKNAVKKAKLLVESTKNDTELLRQNINFNVKRYYYDVQSTERQIENSKDKVLKALENLEITNNSYINGKSDYIELQMARQNYNSAKIEHILKIYKYNISLAKLERITHKHIEEVLKYSKIKGEIEKI